jgi:uncharacterized protein Yka (UPF0111/DUF47 family)
MSRATNWFLPEEPDVVGQLRAQLAITADTLAACLRWAQGDPAAAAEAKANEARARESKMQLMRAIREAFVLPIEPEDAFALSRGIDWILNLTGDLIAEAEALGAEPDAGIAEMVGLMGEAVAQLDEAISHLNNNTDLGIAAAEEAIEIERRTSDAYYRRMAELLGVEDRHARISHRELYRRCFRISELIGEVAERVMYAVVKQS